MRALTPGFAAAAALWVACAAPPEVHPPQLGTSSEALDTGNGADGLLSVSGTQTIDTPRTRLATGQAAGTTTLPVGSAAGFIATQEVLLLDPGAPGLNYQTARLANVDAVAQILTLTAGTAQAFSSQTIVMRLPNFSRVNIGAAGVLTAAPYDGDAGGIVAFRSSGLVSLGGSISVDGLGLPGAPITAGAAPGMGGTAGAGGPNGLNCTVNPIGGGSPGTMGGDLGTNSNAGCAEYESTGKCINITANCHSGAGGPGAQSGTLAPAPANGIGNAGSSAPNGSAPDAGLLLWGSGGGSGIGAAGGAGGGGGGGGGAPCGAGGTGFGGANGVAGLDGLSSAPGGAGGSGGGIVLIWADSVQWTGSITARGQSGTAGAIGGTGGGGGGGGMGGGGADVGGGGGGGGSGGVGGNGGGGGGGGAGGTVQLFTFAQGGTPAIDVSGGDGGPGGNGGTGGIAGAGVGGGTGTSFPGANGAPGFAGDAGLSGANGAPGATGFSAIALSTRPPPPDGGSGAGDSGLPDAGSTGNPDAGNPGGPDAGTPPTALHSHYSCGSAGGLGLSGLVLIGLLALSRRRRAGGWALLVALCALPLGTARAAEPARKPKLAFMGIGTSHGIEKDAVTPLSEFIQTELARSGQYNVMGPKEIATLLGLERQKQLLGCSESNCSAEIAGALDADRAVGGDLSRVSDTFLLSLTLVDLKTGQNLGRASRRTTGDKLGPMLEEVHGAVQELLGHDPAVKVVDDSFRGLWVGPRVDGDVSTPAAVAGLSAGWRAQFWGVAGSVLFAKTVGARLEARVHPWSFGPVLPYLGAGGTVFAPDVGLRGALGVEVSVVDHLRVAADAAYEAYVKNSSSTTANSVLLGGGVNWTF